MGNDIINRTSWDQAGKTWTLAGMAEAMFDWLGERVPDDNGDLTSIKGYTLAGTLNPDNPTIDAIPEPPKWLTPEIQMKAACAWYAASMQDFLIQSGMIPVLRGEISMTSGAITNLVSAIPTNYLDSGMSTVGGTGFYFIVDQKEAPYPLSEKSAIFLQPVGEIDSGTNSPILVRTTTHLETTTNGIVTDLTEYGGWICSTDAVDVDSYYIRVFA